MQIMKSRLKKYGYINAKLRTRIGKLLDDEFFTRLIESRNLDDAFQLLESSPFKGLKDTWESSRDLRQAELMLTQREINLYLEIFKYVEKDLLDFVKALVNRYEIDNLKNILRLWFRKKLDPHMTEDTIEEEKQYLYPNPIIHHLPIEGILNAENIEKVALLLKETPYLDVIDEGISDFKEINSLFPIEIALDKYFYINLTDAIGSLSKTDSRIAKRFIGVEIDIQNVEWIVRLKSMYNFPAEKAVSFLIPNGYSLKAKSFASVYSLQPMEIITTLMKGSYERFASLLFTGTQDSYARLELLESMLKEIEKREVFHILCGYPFTVGIMLAYFILKRNEIRKIITILNAKYYRKGQEEIRAML